MEPLLLLPAAAFVAGLVARPAHRAMVMASARHTLAHSRRVRA